MKYFKNSNDVIYAYEDDVPEFGEGANGEITVREGLTFITHEEAKIILDESNKLTQEQISISNEQLIQALIGESTQKIAIFQDALDLNMVEDGKEDRLKAWKKYRVLLSKVDTSVEEMALPEKPS